MKIILSGTARKDSLEVKGPEVVLGKQTRAENRKDTRTGKRRVTGDQAEGTASPCPLDGEVCNSSLLPFSRERPFKWVPIA